MFKSQYSQKSQQQLTFLELHTESGNIFPRYSNKDGEILILTYVILKTLKYLAAIGYTIVIETEIRVLTGINEFAYGLLVYLTMFTNFMYAFVWL